MMSKDCYRDFALPSFNSPTGPGIVERLDGVNLSRRGDHFHKTPVALPPSQVLLQWLPHEYCLQTSELFNMNYLISANWQCCIQTFIKHDTRTDTLWSLTSWTLDPIPLPTASDLPVCHDYQNVTIWGRLYKGWILLPSDSDVSYISRNVWKALKWT